MPGEYPKDLVRPILTVGDLKAFIAQFEARRGVGCLDAYKLHVMNLDESSVDAEAPGYVTDVEADIFDSTDGTDEGDPVHVLSFMAWQGQPRGSE